VLVLKNDEFVGRSVLDNKQILAEDTLRTMLTFIPPGSTVVEAGGSQAAQPAADAAQAQTRPARQQLRAGGLIRALPPPPHPPLPGGNLGTYTVFLADKVGPKGRVVTFEPQNLVYQNLAANMLFNGYTNVQAINGAAYFTDGLVRMSAKVGAGPLAGRLGPGARRARGSAAPAAAAAGRRAMHRGQARRKQLTGAPLGPAPHLLQLPDGVGAGKDIAELTQAQGKVNYGGMSLGHDGELTVARTIDSLGLGNVSFIKIDVQGAERLVIYGARETIKRCLPVVNYEDAAHLGFGEGRRRSRPAFAASAGHAMLPPAPAARRPRRCCLPAHLHARRRRVVRGVRRRRARHARGGEEVQRPQVPHQPGLLAGQGGGHRPVLVPARLRGARGAGWGAVARGVADGVMEARLCGGWGAVHVLLY
jgi:hypothetical protein